MTIYQAALFSTCCLLSLAACGTDSDDGAGGNGGGTSGDTCPHDYAGYTGGSAEVSLRRDLLKLPEPGKPGGMFRFSCAFTRTCHGAEENSGGASLYLGSQSGTNGDDLTEEQINLVYSNLVGAAAVASALKRVEPGKPEDSFLMHKLDGCLEEIRTTCTLEVSSKNPHPCGVPMPQGSPKQPEAERELVRAWIKQGAQNN